MFEQSRGMNTMPTVRRGRTHYRPGPNDKRGLGGICSVLFIILLILLPPLLLIGSERARHVRYLTLMEAFNSDIIEINHDILKDSDTVRALNKNPANAKSIIPPESLVHGTSSSINAITSDSQMDIAIPGALTLKRNTEYCQWQEIPSQHCQTCTRTVKAQDGSTKEESYSCNCVTHYDYVKAWRSMRINSMLFDQPGAHYNPQRDPMPSRMFAAEDATLSFREGEGPQNNEDETTNQQHQNEHNNKKNNSLQAHLNTAMLSKGIRNQPWRRIDFVLNGMTPPPSFFSRLFSNIFPSSWFSNTHNTRYEPLNLLRDTPTSIAATRDNFVYVGQGGYFFSPYENKFMSSKLFNYFVQYMEGSLFDWQLGDLMPSCTAGDVRVRYEVQDPTVVSVLGQIGIDGYSNGLEIKPRIMESEALLGLVHSGWHSAQQMLIAEDNDSRNAALWIRALLLLWSIPASRLVGVAFGREIGDSSMMIQIMGTIGSFGVVLGQTWLLIWGVSFSSEAAGGGCRDTVILIVMGWYFAYTAIKSTPKMKGGRWWHAVWCRIGSWANTPPDWRVEDTYTVKGESIASETKSKML